MITRSESSCEIPNLSYLHKKKLVTSGGKEVLKLTIYKP